MARPPAPNHPASESTDDTVESSIPRGVRLSAAWSWRLLLIGAVIAVVVFLIVQLRLIVFRSFDYRVHHVCLPALFHLRAHELPNFIGALVRATTVRPAGTVVTLSDKLDRYLTHRWLGLPIFLTRP